MRNAAAWFCGALISGQQLQVGGGTRGNGPLRLNCLTEKCNSIPMDWLLPTDEILARVEKPAAEERKAAKPKPAAVITDIPSQCQPLKRTTTLFRD